MSVRAAFIRPLRRRFAAPPLFVCALLGLAAVASGTTSEAWAAEPAAVSPMLGLWQAFDDKTQRATSFIEILWQPQAQGQTLAGKVAKVIPSPGANPDPLCEHCAGDLHGRRIEGLTILWGLTPANADMTQFAGGTVLDPTTGKTYRCSLRLRPDGQLEVRGFLGLPLFGRTQLWRRPAASAASPR